MKENRNVNGYSNADTKRPTTFAGLEKFAKPNLKDAKGGSSNYGYYDEYGNYFPYAIAVGGGVDIEPIWD